MTDAEIETAVLTALASVAPEVEEMTLDRTRNIRDQLEIDSMDFLNFMLALNQSLGVEVPEQDYDRVVSIAGCVSYLAPKLGGR
jgi:acyl carrier protein